MEDKTHKRDFTPHWTYKGGDWQALAALLMMPRQDLDESPKGTKGHNSGRSSRLQKRAEQLTCQSADRLVTEFIL